MPNKAMKNRPQKTWAGLAIARLLWRRYAASVLSISFLFWHRAKAVLPIHND
jgi:hypothetical protein